MSGAERFDDLVVGSGEAGKYIAWTLAKTGRRVAVIERSLIGGSCPNVACLPSKNVIHSAKVAALCRRAAEFGISTGPIGVDMRGVRRRKRDMVDDLIAIHQSNFAESGAQLIMGEARFVAPMKLDVSLQEGGEQRLSGTRVFLDVGTRPAVPDIPGLRTASPLTHVEALELDQVPADLIIVGGGYVGVEFAQALRRFGARVTIIQRGSQILSREDPDVAEALLRQFSDDGIAVVLNARIRDVSGRSGERIVVNVDADGEARVIEGSHVLVAAGRVPNTRTLGLDAAGVELDERGYVKVNERLETTSPNTWAMGECAGSPQFTHVAFDDFRIVRDNLLGGHRTTTDRLVPYCVFTDPELGRVGVNETQAQRAGRTYRVAKLPMAKVLRTRTLSDTSGFMKALIAADSDRILGFTALGAEAGELIAVVQAAMLMQAPYTTLRDGIFTHPTIAEGLTVLFADEPLRP